MLGSPAGPGGPAQRGGLWPLAPAPTPSATSFTADGFSKYGIYSFLPGSPAFGSALYSHSSIGRFATGSIQQQQQQQQPSSGTAFHAAAAAAAATAAAHKDSLFTSTGYTFGAPTPPPGSPYSPVPITHLEFLAKGYNSTNNFIIQQQPDLLLHSPTNNNNNHKRRFVDEKCVCLKTSKLCTCSHGNKFSSKSSSSFLDSPVSIGGGCSRTNPLDWSAVNVKKEPGAAGTTGTPCQVAEITTSVSPVVKVEVTSPTQKGADVHTSQQPVSTVQPPPVVTTNGNIPVGIAVARQRIQHEVVSSPSLPPQGLLATVNATQIKEVARISEITADSAGMAATSTAAGVAGGGTLLHCHDDRNGGGFASWPVGGAHNSALATPTLWQYPAPLPMEPLVPMPVPMPPVGFQLVRDHNTGGLLLLPTTSVEQLQQTVVWPSYHQPSSHVLLPHLPPPPLQLLSSATSDYLQTSTTLHQHTHSTHRLLALTTDTKRKLPLPIPTTTFIKIETDATTLDQTKTLQAVSTIANNTATVYTDPNMTPLVTTHVIYQHPATAATTATNLILSQQQHPPTNLTETVCRSQATSPVACLTPPPELLDDEEEFETKCQDASNQTDVVASSPEDDINVQDEEDEEVQNEEVESSVSNVPESVQQLDVPKIEELLEEAPKPDLSGLELLSNSIVEFENSRKQTAVPIPPVASSSPPANDEVLEGIAQMTIADRDNVPGGEELGGLNLLCALAEQRIMEEVSAERKLEKRKLKLIDGPTYKKFKLKQCDDTQSDSSVKSCSCNKEELFKTYKTKESEEEVRKFIASKSQSLCCKGDWPCMNEMEIDMRKRLADLQRKYREKRRELSLLKPKKHDKKRHHHHHHHHHRSRKKSTNSTDRSTPPPILDKMDNLPEIKSPPELLKPPTLLCAFRSQESSAPTTISTHIESPSYEYESSSKSSKKRKVGRPKKLESSSGSQTVTETIFAKKPKKGNLVGYLLAAKERLIQSVIGQSDPPRFIEETTKPSPIRKKKRNKVKEEKAKIKIEDDHLDADTESILHDDLDDEEEEEEDDISMKMEDPPNECISAKQTIDSRCTLTRVHLEEDKLRVLTGMGGLFYAGRLHAVEPPDVYSITLDGERGNRPHIMSREEILRDAIVEVAPTCTEELTPGTRLCAYWSQQYRCLYPGSVAEPESPNPELDSKFVSVEFDDGDSGRIAIEDIRLLPSDYPIIEYDPNPLLSLSKRRRRASTTDERRSIQSTKSPTPPPISQPPPPPPQLDHLKLLDVEKENQDLNKPDSDAHRERKRLKKRKRDKLKQKLLLLQQHSSSDDKKKKKKHRCSDLEHCKHKKHHKKHRKHHKKHHHSKELPQDVIKVVDDVDPVNNIIIEEEEEEEELEDQKLEETIEFPIQEEDDYSRNVQEEVEEEEDIVANPEDEVTMDDILEAKAQKKFRDRQESCESRSKMSAFLPARQLWGWSGKGYKRPKAKGRSRKQFYRGIQRGEETIQVGDSAVFLSTGRPDRPYIGRIEAMWESLGTMVVKVKWFYHPEETIGCPLNLKYPGALFESPHIDENDVQTISHKCEVLPLKEYTGKLGDDPKGYETIYDNNDIYYLAGYYDPTLTSLRIHSEIPFNKE